VKKKFLSLILTLVMVCSFVPFATAANDEATQAAQTLYELGLFRGTGTNPDSTPIFDLDKTPTRNQAVIMLVRLLGKEDEALAGNWELPFTDVAKGSTAYPYIGYAYANGLTNGTTATTYSGGNPIRANQYITFVLRALGYVSGEDFQVSTAWEFSDEIGLTNGKYSAATKTFTRGDVANISCSALNVCPKGSSQTLLEKLVEQGAVSAGSALLSGMLPGTETEEFYVTPDRDGSYEVSLEGIKRQFPKVKTFSCEAIHYQYNDIDHHLAQCTQMAFLVATNGDSGDWFTKGLYSLEELTGGMRLLLFSEKTKLCGFFNGIPEVRDGKVVLRITRCDYDFSELYAQQKEEFRGIDIPYVAPEQITSSGAEFVMRGYHASTRTNMDNQLGRDRELYMMWRHLTAPISKTGGTQASDWYRLFPISTFSKLLVNGNESYIRYFLLLDGERNLIGYTLA